MRKETINETRERVLSLIETEFKSDAEFEREMKLPGKTVNNWRRGRSASFMRMLPTLSERFGVNALELLNMPLKKDTSELSEEELHLLHLYRKSRSIRLSRSTGISHDFHAMSAALPRCIGSAILVATEGLSFVAVEQCTTGLYRL